MDFNAVLLSFQVWVPEALISTFWITVTTAEDEGAADAIERHRFHGVCVVQNMIFEKCIRLNQKTINNLIEK